MVSKALPGTAAHYAPHASGKPALVVVSPLFENRDKTEREGLVWNSLIAAVRVSPSQYLAEIQCFTPAEFENNMGFVLSCEWVEVNSKTHEYERCKKPQTGRMPKSPDLDLHFCEEHLSRVEAGEHYLPRDGSSVHAFSGGLPELGKRN